jgi:hypothetical protein
VNNQRKRTKENEGGRKGGRERERERELKESRCSIKVTSAVIKSGRLLLK